MARVEFAGKTTNPEMPDVNDVPAEEVHSKLDQLKIVDVRRQDEFVGELGHIAGAELITLDTLEARVNELPKDQTIVFICRSGRRSATASQIAMQNGIDDVYNMLGGMIRWNDLDLPTEN